MQRSPLNLAALATLATLAALAIAPAQAAITVYSSTLSGPAESPPVASPGVGFGIVTLDNTSFTMRVQTVFSNLVGTTTVAHIHCCTTVPGAGTVGVATSTPSFPGFPTGVTAGTYDMTFNMLDAASWNPMFVTANGGTFQTAFAALQGGLNSGRAYLNIHSTFAPGGEIRGFPQAAPIPEPATYGLMAMGLLALGGLVRRRQAV